MQRNGKGFMLTLAIGLAIGVVALGSDRASGQTEIHVLIPTGGDGVVVGGSLVELGDELAGHAALVDPASGDSGRSHSTRPGSEETSQPAGSLLA